MSSQVDLQTVGLALLTILVAILIVNKFQSRGSLDDLPHPKSSSWLYGNEWGIYNHPAGQLWNQWISQYGNVLKYKNAFFNGWTILVADPLAIKTILIDGPDGTAYHKPPFNRDTNERLLGRGVIWAEGQDHRSQRRLLSPAFSTSSVKNVSANFYRTAEDIKDAWFALLDAVKTDTVSVNATEFMSSAALDVIGAAGFEHQFNAVKSATKEAADITDGLTAALGTPPSFKTFISLTLAKAFPTFFNHAPLKAIRSQRESKRTIQKVAQKVLERVEKQDTSDQKSILSIVLRERQQADGLKNSEILDNISTMITAGHETTGITLSLVLYELALDQQLQQKIRHELIGEGSLPTYEQLNAGKAPLLDAVIKEVLRFYPANIRIIRRTDKDQVVPLSKPIKTPAGKSLDSIIIPKGTDIIFPLTSINRLKSAWGEDADVFSVERWLEPGRIPEGNKDLPAGYERIFTFVAGPRACLGMRFAITEMRIILSTIIASFKFTFDGEQPLDIVSPAQIMIRAQDQRRGVYGVPLKISRVNDCGA